MDDPAPGQMHRDARGHWVRLQTLTHVRWLAIVGQSAALIVAQVGFGLSFPLTLCLSVVAVSAASNLISTFVFPRTKRLSEFETLLTLIFDTTQLSLLLFLSGGLNNPFALLLIAPVTIAATALQTRSTLILGGVAATMGTFLAVSFEPLRNAAGDALLLPDLFRFGFWLALMIGVGFIGLYSRSIAWEKQALAEALMATRLALAREQKLTDLGGVVAAAAHELGTPLATIKLVSSELLATLTDPDQREDARLIREQADRCRDILRSMGRAGKDDLHLQQAPLEAVVIEAATPHLDRGRRVTLRAEGTGRMPDILRRPEIIHGLRNLIQNAVDFAEANVTVTMGWTEAEITILVSDDGPGFLPHLLGRIGEPYLRDRAPTESRPGYEGMGLGLFIAKTLLERSGATLRFANAAAPDHGARIALRWPRRAIAADARRALGQNPANPGGL